MLEIKEFTGSNIGDIMMMVSVNTCQLDFTKFEINFNDIYTQVALGIWTWSCKKLCLTGINAFSLYHRRHSTSLRSSREEARLATHFPTGPTV